VNRGACEAVASASAEARREPRAYLVGGTLGFIEQREQLVDVHVQVKTHCVAWPDLAFQLGVRTGVVAVALTELVVLAGRGGILVWFIAKKTTHRRPIGPMVSHTREDSIHGCGSSERPRTSVLRPPR
jgi:hypothetical protein